MFYQVDVSYRWVFEAVCRNHERKNFAAVRRGRVHRWHVKVNLKYSSFEVVKNLNESKFELKKF